MRKFRYRDRSRGLAEGLRAKAKEQTNQYTKSQSLGFTQEEVFEMGLVLAQLGVFPREAVKIARLGRIANVRGLKERDLMRINVKE